MYEKIGKVSIISALVFIALLFTGIVLFNFLLVKIGAIGSINSLIIFLVSIILDGWDIR